MQEITDWSVVPLSIPLCCTAPIPPSTLEFVSFTLNKHPLLDTPSQTLQEKLIQHTDHLNHEVPPLPPFLSHSLPLPPLLLSPQVCQVTLQLFDVLLLSPLPSVIHELVLKHWRGEAEVELIIPTERLASERQSLEETITR